MKNLKQACLGTVAVGRTQKVIQLYRKWVLRRLRSPGMEMAKAQTTGQLVHPNRELRC